MGTFTSGPLSKTYRYWKEKELTPLKMELEKANDKANSLGKLLYDLLEIFMEIEAEGENEKA